MNKTSRIIVSVIGISLLSSPMPHNLQLAQAIVNDTTISLSSETTNNSSENASTETTTNTNNEAATTTTTQNQEIGPLVTETSFRVDGTDKRAKVTIEQSEEENFGVRSTKTTYRVQVITTQDASQTEGGISTQCTSTETCVYTTSGNHNGFSAKLQAQLQTLAKAQIAAINKQKEEAEQARQEQLAKEESCDYEVETEAKALVECLIKNLKEENGLVSADQRRLRSGLAKLIMERNGEREVRSIVRSINRDRDVSEANKKALLEMVNDLTAQKEIIAANERLKTDIVPLFQNSQNDPVALQQAYRDLAMFNARLGQTKYEWFQSAQSLSGDRLNNNAILSSWTDYMPILQGNINLLSMTRPGPNGQLDYTGFRNYPEIGFDQDTLNAIDQAQATIQQRIIGNGRFQRGGNTQFQQQGIPNQNGGYHPGQGGRFQRGRGQMMQQNFNNQGFNNQGFNNQNFNGGFQQNFNNGFQTNPNQMNSFRNFNGSFR